MLFAVSAAQAQGSYEPGVNGGGRESWTKKLCKRTSHAAVIHITSVQTALHHEAPIQRAQGILLWTSNEASFTTSEFEFDQYGGCIEGTCWSNNAIHNVQAGETWLLFFAKTPRPASPLALGKNGMFRVAAKLGHYQFNEAAFDVTTVSGRPLALSPGGSVELAPTTEVSISSTLVSVVDIVNTVFDACAEMAE